MGYLPLESDESPELVYNVPEKWVFIQRLGAVELMIVSGGQWRAGSGRQRLMYLCQAKTCSHE